MKILPCTGNRPLGEAIAAYLKAPLVQASLQRFADQEISVNISESVRGQDIFVIQPTSPPTNDRLMELLITIDTLKRGAARSVIAVIPYYGYGRQNRKTLLHNSISAKLVANLLTAAGADHIVTIDWHCESIQGFFDIPTNNLTLAPLFSQEIQKRHKKNPVVVVSPDIGGLSRARSVANHLSADLAIIDKQRSQQGEATVVNLIGAVAGQNCVLIDDIIDSGRTLYQAAEALMSAGALMFPMGYYQVTPLKGWPHLH